MGLAMHSSYYVTVQAGFMGLDNSRYINL
ncbi:hypothetical protein SCFA_3910005 [anaerobic digester metagenome]|uniref:Uncharacterized protein n=1 Tax=anaerobic digester metagenome TaxID=1263854 RepID=A0A485M695_9ZZZZ